MMSEQRNFSEYKQLSKNNYPLDNNYKIHYNQKINVMETLHNISIGLKNVDHNAEDTKKMLDSPKARGMIRPSLRKKIDEEIQSAITGDSYSQNYIGVNYLSGQIFDNDFQRAAKWLSLAALQENQDAILSLAKIIKGGHYIPKEIDRIEFSNALVNTAKEIIDYDALIDKSSK